MIVNVCPAAVSSASPDRIWTILTTPEKFEEWQDARFVSSEPPGSVQTGQVIHLAARGYGREWPVQIDVGKIDPKHRWIDLVVHLPLGVTNREHATLAETPEGGTLIRLN